MRTDYNRVFYRDYEKLQEKNEQLLEKNRSMSKENKRWQRLYEVARKEKERAQAEKERLQAEKEELKAQNEALKKEIARLNGILNLDGTNSGTPTSKTPLHKKKVVPNSREKTGRKRGGQPGHPEAKLKAFSEEEITEDAIHGYDRCPKCGGELKRLEEETCKDELDYEVVVIKRRHHFPKYICLQCGKQIAQPVPETLKAENQYGAQTQALALSLTNVGNVPMNKAGRVICGLSQGDVHPTNGYIAKLQHRAAKRLELFKQELVKRCIRLPLVYWDDTVIFVATKRACLRFYGDEKLALYFAHAHKDKAGIDEDKILPMLPETTHVMHDHVIVNYSDDYSFQNIECCQHLLRDLQKVTDTLQRKWSKRLKEHIQQAIHDRNTAVEAGKEAFPFEYVETFFSTFNQILLQANKEHGENHAYYYYQEEAALILRLLEYKNNYFAWVTCFDLPVTNNLSERSLRGAKTHMKVSGQFQSIEYAQYYATILSYIETCRRNGINEMTALVRLCNDAPFSVAEILDSSSAE